MQKTKLTVRVPRHLVENAKDYASLHQTTLTALIEAFLQRIPSISSTKQTPIVSSLIGILSSDLSLEDYKEHLERKYG
jgi:hypothetical protein